MLPLAVPLTEVIVDTGLKAFDPVTAPSTPANKTCSPASPLADPAASEVLVPAVPPEAVLQFLVPSEIVSAVPAAIVIPLFITICI